MLTRERVFYFTVALLLVFGLCSCGGTSPGDQNGNPGDAPLSIDSLVLGNSVMDMPATCENCMCTSTDCGNPGELAGLPLLLANVVVKASSVDVDDYWFKADMVCNLNDGVKSFGLFMLDPGAEDPNETIVDKLHVDFAIEAGRALGLPIFVFPSKEAYDALKAQDRDTGCDVVLSISLDGSSFSDYVPGMDGFGSEDMSPDVETAPAVYLLQIENQSQGLPGAAEKEGPYSEDLFKRLHWKQDFIALKDKLQAGYDVDISGTYAPMDQKTKVPYAVRFEGKVYAGCKFFGPEIGLVDGAGVVDLNAQFPLNSFYEYHFYALDKKIVDIEPYKWQPKASDLKVKVSDTKTVPTDWVLIDYTVDQFVIRMTMKGTVGIEYGYEVDLTNANGRDGAKADVFVVPIARNLTVYPTVTARNLTVGGTATLINVLQAKLDATLTVSPKVPKADLSLMKEPISFDALSGNIRAGDPLNMDIVNFKGLTCNLNWDPPISVVVTTRGWQWRKPECHFGCKYKD